ncbi:MAG: sugar ABC transporter permease [bacterium]|nr:sugar ABC transporter permease [bacterium]
MGKANKKRVRHKLTRRDRNDYIWGYAMVAPLVIGLLVFYFYPFFQSIYMSFTKTGAFNQSQWNGIENYVELIGDKTFWQSLKNTFVFVVMTVPVGIFLSMVLAALLNSKIKGTSFYRTIYFLPSVTMAAAISLVWKWIYNGDYGLLNAVLGMFGIKGMSWLTNPKTVMVAIGVVGIWCSCGYNTIILLAGLQGISSSYYEAAAIDGAGPLYVFRKITFPLLSPTIFFVVVTSLINGLKTFDLVYMMVPKESPVYKQAQTVVMYFYRNAFDYANKGYASAIAVAIFVIIMLLTILQMRMQKHWVIYE